MIDLLKNNRKNLILELPIIFLIGSFLLWFTVKYNLIHLCLKSQGQCYNDCHVGEFLILFFYLSLVSSFLAIRRWSTASKLNAALAASNQSLKIASDEIKTLKGILPICSFCKKIRDNEGYWQAVEKYISENSEALFSHGLCPSCMRKEYPEESADILNRQE